jgi:hypothetical protein
MILAWRRVSLPLESWSSQGSGTWDFRPASVAGNAGFQAMPWLLLTSYVRTKTSAQPMCERQSVLHYSKAKIDSDDSLISSVMHATV